MSEFRFEVGKRYKRKNTPNAKSFECVYAFKDGKEAIFKDEDDPLFTSEFHVANYSNTFEVDAPEVIHEVMIRESKKGSLLLETREHLSTVVDSSWRTLRENDIPRILLGKSKGFLYITTKGGDIVNVEFSKERRE